MPGALGVRDVLIAERRIVQITEPGQMRRQGVDVEIVDASGETAIPGFVGGHAHVLGGGGEDGPCYWQKKHTIFLNFTDQKWLYS